MNEKPKLYSINLHIGNLISRQSITRQNIWVLSVSIFISFPSFEELAFRSSYRAIVTPGLQRYSALPLSFSFSFFLCHRLHIIPPPHLVRGRRRPLFFIFDIRPLSVPFSWKPMLLPSRIGTDAGGLFGREGSTFFFTFLLYMDSTVRPLGANRWHAGEVEMLPT